jgi:hypothetical protein
MSDAATPGDDELWDAVDTLLAVFDRAGAMAPELRSSMAHAKQAREAGATWPDLAPPGSEAQLITATNGLLDDLVNVGARLRRLVAQSMHAEGLTMDAIADMFGVSRQRISTLIRSDADTTQGPWTRTRRSKR